MWMRVDDGLHAHRKTRTVTKSHDEKRRDAAPMGLWVLAGSWSGRNNQDGWVPCDELDRFDDEWEPLAARLVDSGFWWPEERNGEDGYGFNDWGEWNNPTGPSASGTFGNHVRWHEKKGVVKDGCEHCPQEPMSAEDEECIAPISGAIRPDHRPESGGESLRDHRPESLTRARPEPDPTRAELEPLSRDESLETDPLDRFEEFWDTYAKKVDRKKAEAKWRLALKRKGVTPDLLIESARAYVTWEREHNEGGRFVMDPARWLNGHRWEDERPARPEPMNNVQQHLALARRLHEQEQGATIREIGPRR